MKTLLKRAGSALLVVALILLVVGVVQRERITRVMAVMSLFDADKIVGNFTAMETLFESAEMPLADGPPNVLPSGPTMQMPAGYLAWAEERQVTGIVVLKDGLVRYESYPLSANGREDDPATRLRMSWSVAKSFLSVLMGIVVEDGSINSIDDPVTKYAPSLTGSAYDGTTIRDVLLMSSGVTFDEDYADFWSDINKMGRVLGLGMSMDAFAEGLTETFAEPGTQWQYVSIDTHVLGMVIRGATGRSIPDLLNERVLQPLRLTRAPFYVTDGHGVAFVLGGLNLTTRDYALFGYMVANGGIAFGERIVSEAWIEESTRALANKDPNDIYGYGYQWWIPNGAPSGVFLGRGVYGQYLYIDQNRDTVVAVNSADRDFKADGVQAEVLEMLQRISEAIE